MGERTSYTPGTFCWADLVSPDTDAAKQFYASLFGWDYEGPIAKLDGKAVAAIVPLTDSSVAPHWNTYVSVEDADAAAVRAAKLGASVVLVGDVGESGRLAVVEDPQGAFINVWQPRAYAGAALVNGPGLLSWNDVISPDVEASAAFYRELFGWTITEIAEGQYWSIANDGNAQGGLMALPPGGHPAWNVYFGVEDAEATIARVSELGGGTILGPLAVPSGQFAILHDAQRAVFSVVDGEFDA